MWLVSPTRGFISAVAHRDYPDVIIVRARAKEDLLAWLEIADQEASVVLDLVPDDDADYRWRLELGRGEFVRMVAASAEEVSWTNVKDAAWKAGKKRLEKAMHDVWWALMALDDRPGGKYGYRLNAPLPKVDVSFDGVGDQLEDLVRSQKRGSRRGGGKKKGGRS